MIKNKTDFKKRKPITELYCQNIKTLFIIALLAIGIRTSLNAQESSPQKYSKPSWWFGASAGANFNFYRGSTQKLNSDLTIPVAFHNGFGAGLYLGPLVEFHRQGSRWGAMFQAGYDSRKATFKSVVSPCNCPNELNTKLSYITIEPSLRFAPFKSNLYLYGGPSLAFNLNKSFTYQLKTNPDYPNQEESAEVKGDFSDVNKMLVSMQIGIGYDIPIYSNTKKSQLVLSPFIAFHPYFGRSPRTIETWNITTLRGGIALKFGHGQKS